MTNQSTDSVVLTGARIEPAVAAPGRQAPDTLVVENGTIAWFGTQPDVPEQWQAAAVVDLRGALLTPALVECHADLLFGGPPDEDLDRWTRLRATGVADDERLVAVAHERADRFVQQGVGTLECKVPYVGDADRTFELLALAGRIRDTLPIRIHLSVLAGSCYPTAADPEECETFILELCDQFLPRLYDAAGFDDVEVYCEEQDGLTMEDCSTILETVYRRKLPTRVAADRHTDSAGGALAPAFYAKAAVYLTHTDDIAVKAMAANGTTAVLVPDFDDQDAARPPVELLREAGVTMAVSAGFEPGPTARDSLLASAAESMSQYGFSASQAFAGVTAHAAQALGHRDGLGRLEIGAPADLASWNAPSIEALLSSPGTAPMRLWSGGIALELRNSSGTP